MEKYPHMKHDYSTNNKVCSKCKKTHTRSPEHFYRDKKQKDGLSYLCKSCKCKIDKQSREDNVHTFKQYQKSPEFVFSQLKYQAKKRKIMFSIALPHYLEHLAYKNCYYCGSTNTNHWVDRYYNDHKIGYTIKNSVPCCELCNKMKSQHNPSVFIEHCKKVTEFNN